MGFALHGTKFFLVMFNQIKPNTLGFFDAFIFGLEAGWSLSVCCVCRQGERLQ